MIPAFDLTGRVALVTGAGSDGGIGFATARLLASMGAAVAVTSTTDRIHDRARTLAAGGADASGHIADLVSASAAAALLSAVVARHGALHIVVNNAGMTSVSSEGESGDLAATSPEVWQAGMDRNVTTAVNVSRGALPHLVGAGYGRIVNVSSVTGAVGAMAGEVVYAAAKAAMIGLTRALAVDLGVHGITVNAVAPGWIATGSSLPRELELGAGTPLARSGTPDEAASAIAWLCTPGASYVTGQCLVIDGGNMTAEERMLLR